MRTKEFDCVEMKRLAQEKVRQKYAGMPEKEAWRLQREAALRDPIIGPLLTRVADRQPARHKR